MLSRRQRVCGVLVWRVMLETWSRVMHLNTVNQYVAAVLGESLYGDTTHTHKQMHSHTDTHAHTHLHGLTSSVSCPLVRKLILQP